MTDCLTMAIDHGVATLTIATPEVRNAITMPVAEAMADRCRDIADDPTIGAVVVRGAEGTFCSGADRAVLARVSEDPLSTPMYRDLQTIYDTFIQVGQLPVPTIAAVRGSVVGAGVNLMLATDLRIVSTTAVIDSGFGRLGFHPGGGHFLLASQAMGREATAAMSLFGQPIDGRRAAEVGLAWEALDDEEVESRAQTIAQTAGRDPELSRHAVASMRREIGPPALSWSAALEVERAPQLWSFARKAQRLRHPPVHPHDATFTQL